ncbi:MAG: hypothetical protein HGA22_00505 [Clostridiales bacterium]|nr:hypothetical protein [Clostridiales bacterium]
MKLKTMKTAFICIFACMFLMTGCTDYLPGNSNRIKSPSNSSNILKGTWNITGRVEGDSATVEGEGQLEGRRFALSEDTLSFGDLSWGDVGYKLKKVKAEDYFLHKLTDGTRQIKITGSDITVITASQDGNFLYEFVILDNDNLLVNIEDEFFYLVRVSNAVEDVSVGNSMFTSGNSGEEKNAVAKDIKSGVLMAVRTDMADGSSTYSTYWISMFNGEPADILVASGIYVPRMDGFWRLKIDKVLGATGLEDSITALHATNKAKLAKSAESVSGDASSSFSFGNEGSYGVVNGASDTYAAYTPAGAADTEAGAAAASGGAAGSAAGEADTAAGAVNGAPDAVAAEDEAAQEAESEAAVKRAAQETGIQKKILYVGNDYSCIETIEPKVLESSGNTYTKETLSTLPISNVANSSGITISDLAGENGIMAMDDGITGIINSKGVSTSNISGAGRQETNFALFRKTGHWFFKGRINFSGNNLIPFLDYNINLIPPSDMVAYDVLQIPWNMIKEKRPEAVDAYTSPNRDMAVLLTGNAAAVYSINKTNLSEESLKEIAIPEGSTVIMAEWALGDYVEKWRSSFAKNNAVTVVPDLID